MQRPSQSNSFDNLAVHLHCCDAVYAVPGATEGYFIEFKNIAKFFNDINKEINNIRAQLDNCVSQYPKKFDKNNLYLA
jgi:hypothetical protein